MAKWLLIALTAVSLGGCVTDRSQLPLALAPSDTAQAACIGDAGAPAFGDCKVFIEPGATVKLTIGSHLDKAPVAIGRGVDDRRLSHHQISHEMARAGADAEAVA